MKAEISLLIRLQPYFACLWLASFFPCLHAEEDDHSKSINSPISKIYPIPPFPDSAEGRLASYGRELIMNSTRLPSTNSPLSGNKLSCTSCHLNGGAKAFAAPYVGLSNMYPKYMAREGREVSIQERVNGCIERSLNGAPINLDSHEMNAIVAYIRHLSTVITPGIKIQGQGFINISIPNRAASPRQGRFVYERHCSRCHGQDGQGGSSSGDDRAYPPLWGSASFNDGAGMARIITAARYIKGNMPLGVGTLADSLTDEEAYDVAAFINSFSRAVKSNKHLDYPDLTKKPKDCGYPPYADNTPHLQHKYGPFDF